MINGERNAHKRLFQPLTIANGRIQLKHRVIYAPMTRNRGVPLRDGLDDRELTRAWYPDQLTAEYYGQRANDGGLLISEGISPTLQVHSSVTYYTSFPPGKLTVRDPKGHRLTRRPWTFPPEANCWMEKGHRRCACEGGVYLCPDLAFRARCSSSVHWDANNFCIGRSMGDGRLFSISSTRNW